MQGNMFFHVCFLRFLPKKVGKFKELAYNSSLLLWVSILYDARCRVFLELDLRYTIVKKTQIWLVFRCLVNSILLLNILTLTGDVAYFFRKFNWLGKSLLINVAYKHCLSKRLMPHPSARTKYFLSRTILKLSTTKILSRVKKFIFSFQKSIKIWFPDWKCRENLFSTRNVHFEWLLKAKNGVFCHGRNFCPGQF